MDPRIRRTEHAVLAAAKALFEKQGYAATTVSQVAQEADVAERTVFLRFDSKADLLRRVVDETFRGAVEGSTGSADRRRAIYEGTLDERLRAFAEGASHALVRTGAMFAVAREAEASEPSIAAASDAARREVLARSRRMWRTFADDGLLGADVDVEWVADTTALLGSADTYLLMSATHGWTQEEFAAWLYRTWRFFATATVPGRGRPAR